jgi:hypothetical protein
MSAGARHQESAVLAMTFGESFVKNPKVKTGQKLLGF